MTLRDVIVNAVATAKTLTADLQCTVQYTPKIGVDDFGAPVYGPTVPMQAIVERKQRLVKNREAIDVMSQSYVAFLEQVDIDPQDKIVLPGGDTGPILNWTGMMDSESVAGLTYYAEVFLG